MGQSGIVHIIAILVIVLIVLVVGLAWVFTSSNNIPGGSTSNGSNNPNPTANTTLLPGQASAQVVVTINSIHSIFDVHYSLYLNSDLVADGTLTSGSSIVQTLTVFFPENQTGQYSATISATSSGGFLGAKSSLVVVTPENGGIYPVTLSI